ncbi:MAG TPA: DUF2752 domain-containing protein [Sporichthyaceae bacterium]|nr:DUF2752 domain-containing protein [Sporichthyaceae bacterium]
MSLAVASRSAASSLRRLPAVSAPLATLTATATALATLAVRNPEQPGHYPVCPFHAMTGLWCPGCGSLRALHALTHGDLATAMQRNILAVLAVPFLAMAWVAWLGRTLGRPRSTRVAPPAVLWGLLVLIVAFGVVRNLPGADWLAPQP